MRNVLLSAGVVVGVLASHASAWEFRTRFVQRVGNIDIPIETDVLEMVPYHSPTRLRLQCGVFDDAAGPAPAGGVAGWFGAVSFSGLSDPLAAGARRTPGRLAPFTYSTGNFANGNPHADPFAGLTEINCTLGTQSPIWSCDANGNPLPQPAAIAYGFNSFISTYEISLTPAEFGLVFDMTFSGLFVAVTEWRTIGNTIPPDCSDPDNPVPGFLIYGPLVPTAPEPFSQTLTIVTNGVPAPASIGLLAISGIIAARRSRRAVSC